MSLMCQVQITLDSVSAKKASAVRKALEPDNVNFPDGLSLSVEDMGNKVIFKFESRQDIKKMIGTIDEVLEHVQVALKVME